MTTATEAPANMDTAGLAGAGPVFPSTSTPLVQGPPSALPSLNPADSPYTPLSIPEVPQPAKHPLPDQQPQQNLGAVNKTGAAAYLVDQVLRGAVQGYDAHQQRRADQANKKMKALSDLQNQVGQQYVQAYNEVGSSQPGMTAEQINADPKVKALRNQLLAVHQATLSAVQGYLGDGAAGGGAGGAGGGGGKKSKKSDPGNQLQTYYTAASQLGPPAFYQVASPQQLAAMYQQRQGAAAGQTQATSEAQIGARKAQLESDLVAAEGRGDTAGAAQIKKSLEDLSEATSPYRRPTEADQKRADYQALITSGQAPKDQQGNPLSFEAWSAQQGAAGRVAGSPAKDPIPYNVNTGTIFDSRNGKTYSPTDLNLPLDVASKFKAADNQAFKKQQRALQLVAERGQAYLSGKVVQVADPSQPGSVIYMRALDAIKQGVSTPASIWFKLEMPTGTERRAADLAVSAREQLNTMAEILTKRPDLFGPVAGRATDFDAWLGSSDPDARRLNAAMETAAGHLSGVFGGHQKAMDGIKQAIGANKMNPQGAIAALEQMNVAAARIQAAGTRPGLVSPAEPTPPASTAAPAPTSSGTFDVTDPTGKIHHFDSQAQADHFKQLAGIK